jgi:hypothetical protein
LFLYFLGLPCRDFGGLVRVMENLALLRARLGHQLACVSDSLLNKLVRHQLRLAEESNSLWVDRILYRLEVRLAGAVSLNLGAKALVLCADLRALGVSSLHLVCEQIEVLANLRLVKTAHSV